MKDKNGDGGFSLVELVIGITVLTVVAISFLTLFTSLIRSTLTAKRKAVASSLATNQIEYLKSISYDSLAVAGGSIYSASPLPANTTEKVDGFNYTITTSINYIDDAFDGCTNYPTQAIKEKLCRNYPPPTSQTSTDTNPADYKIVNVAVKDASNNTLASVDTQIAARVAETSSTTGALVVTVIDENGNPIQGASVNVSNTTTTPAINLTDSSDSNGIAIFYNLPPDSNNFDYLISGSKSNFSSLNTITPTALTPTYSNQKIFTQSSAFVSLVLKKQGSDSLVLEAKDLSGTNLANLKIYLKGGYKKFSSSTDTQYYYDNMLPSDNRPSTDSNGLVAFSNLVPGAYYACGDSGSTSCVIGGTNYYLVASIPYGGSSAYLPVVVPSYDPGNPPAITFPYQTKNYYQKNRMIMTTSSTFPRLNNINSHEISLSTDNIGAYNFQINGANLPCTSSAASCSTLVKVIQGSNTFTASCTGTSAGLTLDCLINLTGIVAGSTQISITVGSNNYTSPPDMILGSFNVIP